MSDIDQSVFAPQLRVFRQLDVKKLSPDFIETVGAAEGSVEWVDAARARDQIWTEEIMDATIGAAIVDARGEFVKTFPGKDGFLAAEKSRSSARVVFDYDLVEETTAEEDALPAGFADYQSAATQGQ